MKKIYFSFLFAALSCMTLQTSQAQVWMGIYGVRSNTTNSFNPDIGGGFSWSMLSDATSFGKSAAGTATPATTAAPSAIKAGSPLKIQFGGNFFWSGLGHRTFNNVPLTGTQSGLAKVTLQNSFFGMNLLARVSAPNKSIFTPYGEAYLGYRGTFSHMNVEPYVQQVGYKSQTDNSIAHVSGFNYGVGGGITTDLTKSKRLKLDVGVSYIEQLGRGDYVDLNAANADATGINLNMKSVPNGILMMNVGLLFRIEADDDDDDCDCKCKHHRGYNSTSPAGSWGGWSGSGGGRSSSVNVHFGGGGGGFGGVKAK